MLASDFLVYIPRTFAMLTLLLFILFRQGGTIAAPISSAGHHTLVATGANDPEQSSTACPGRSAWDILWSCWATTLTVTWVSVHPNIQWLGEDKWSILRRRLFLMFLALLAPEIMCVWAFRQWRGAVMIREMINKAQPKSYKPWSVKHGHFLQMGGFKLICTKDEVYDKDFLNKSDWVSINKRYAYRVEGKDELWQGVLDFHRFKDLLSSHSIDFPETTEEEIDDRSKGDALSKGVALLQISWFIVQLVARVWQGLVVTEIELTTAALAGLNTVMYLCWWSKPLDVQCPIIIRTKEAEKILAERETYTGEWSFDEDCRFADYLLLVAKRVMQRFILDLAVLLYWRRIFNGFHEIYCSFKAIPGRMGSAASHFIEYLRDLGSRNRRPTTNHKLVPSLLHGIMHWVWSLFLCRLLYLPHILIFLPAERILYPFWLVEPDGFEDVRVKLHSLSITTLLFDEFELKWILSMIFYSYHADIKPLLFVSASAGAAFGLVHCAAWNFGFQTQTEQILWRVSSLALVGACLSIIVGSPLYGFLFTKWKDAHYRHHPQKSSRYWAIWKRPLETSLATIYPLARVALLLLALLSLRNLPDSALETVTWTKIIPHI